MDIERSQYFPAELFVLCCPNKANFVIKSNCWHNMMNLGQSQYFPAELFVLCFPNKANFVIKSNCWHNTINIEQSQYFPAELYVLCCPNKANLSFKTNIDTTRWTLNLHSTSQLSCLSHGMRFPTMWYVWPAKAQTSLCIRIVWSEPLLVAWIFDDS